MSQESLTVKLVQAKTNIRKLCEFLVARQEWTYRGDADEAMRELEDATSGVGEELRRLMALCGANPFGEKTPDVVNLGEGEHDTARIQRFVTFLRDLRFWFTVQTSPPTDSDGVAALREMDGYIRCMDTIIFDARKKHLEAPPVFSETESEPEPSKPEAEPAAPLEANPAVFEKCPPQLVLDNTEANPMVQEFQGRLELTSECERLADAYLEAWDLEFSYYNRKKLLERILRWITSAPEGQVLVIKMKTIGEPHEPYPSYLSREVLQNRQLPKEE